MFRHFLGKSLLPSLAANTPFNSTVPTLFKRYQSYLVTQQPFAPHSKEFLQLQSHVISKVHNLKKDQLSRIKLKKGTELVGLTNNFNTIYGGIPLYESSFRVTKEEFDSIQSSIKKLGAKWALYSLTDDIECVVRLTPGGEMRYFICHDFLDVKKELDPTLQDQIAKVEKATPLLSL